MKTEKSTKYKNKQSGVAMLEALIAVFIFSLAVLGLMGLQANMVKNATQSKARTEAAYIADQLIGMLWADRSSMDNYADTSCSTYAPCNNWKTSALTLLPSANIQVTISKNANTVSTVNDLATIRVEWTMPGESSPNNYQIDATIPNQ